MVGDAQIASFLLDGDLLREELGPVQRIGGSVSGLTWPSGTEKQKSTLET